jgi:hypothetical protein
MPDLHIRIRHATVLPRIMLKSLEEEMRLRSEMGAALDGILSLKDVIVDNSPPLNFGFSTGFFLSFSGLNNVALKSKLYRVYMRYCPALRNGYFLQPNPNSQVYTKSSTSQAMAHTTATPPILLGESEVSDSTTMPPDALSKVNDAQYMVLVLSV